jgi:GT2 family glycosyltransferase
LNRESENLPGGAYPFVSVIIPIFNHTETLGKCLETLSKQRYPHFEVIIVNDGSSDRTPEKIVMGHGRPDFQIISLPENQGVSAARNMGMKKARGEVFVFSDADCFYESDWLRDLVQPLQAPQTGCSGGPDQVPASADLKSKCIDYSMHSLIASGGIRRGETRLAKYSPAGCNMAVKREVIEKVGVFNPSLRHRGEEKELEHRIRKGGYDIVYVKNARVWHHRRSTIKAFTRQTFASGTARMDIVRLFPDALELAHFIPALLTGVVFLAGIASLFASAVRPVWISMLAVYLLLLVTDGLIGAVKLRSFRALFIIPLTSAAVHIAYGTGSILRWLRG